MDTDIACSSGYGPGSRALTPPGVLEMENPRYHLIPGRMAIIQRTKNSKCWQGGEERGNSYILLVEM